MKFIALVLSLFVSSMLMAANALTEADLVGQFSLVGNDGLLSYGLTFNSDGTAGLSQMTLDGSEIVCHGRYTLDAATQDFASIYDCEAGEVLTQEFSLAGISGVDLLNGVNVLVHIKSSLGSDSTVKMFFKDRNLSPPSGKNF